MNSTQPCDEKTPVRAALEDAGVVAGYTAAGLLSADAIYTHGLPTFGIVWAVAIASLLAGIVAYSRCRGIQLPIPPTTPPTP